MFRPTMTTPAAAAGLVVMVPVAALAGAIAVDHGHGPTYVHDATYADVETQVHSWASEGRTEIRLMVDGLPAGRTFGAHVHVNPCGAVATDSGGHYQHGDATQPLSAREIWLDFTTDAEGHGVGRTTVPWEIDAGTAGSVVVHASPTDPISGVAGARLFCTTVPFGS
jgi:superoxide dismutase, Cu-Zn family